VNLYDRLFSVEEPDKDKESDPEEFINPHSLERVNGYIEPTVSNASKGEKFQFQRLGYFVLDENKDGNLVFNKTVGLRDTWSKN